MKSHSLLLTLTTALVLVAATPASARVFELGTVTGDRMTPSCPGNPCLAVTRTTGFQATSGTTRKLVRGSGHRSRGGVHACAWVAPAPARSASSTARPAAPRACGSRSCARPGRVPAHRRYVLNAQSDEFRVQPYFGQTVQIPLYTSLLVRRGYVVALTVPTWAPVLAVSGLSNTFAWRSSRVAPCSTNPERQPPHSEPGSTKAYFCLYRPAALTYSATIVTTPAVTPVPQRGGGGGGNDDN